MTLASTCSTLQQAADTDWTVAPADLLADKAKRTLQALGITLTVQIEPQNTHGEPENIVQRLPNNLARSLR